MLSQASHALKVSLLLNKKKSNRQKAAHKCSVCSYCPTILYIPLVYTAMYKKRCYDVVLGCNQGGSYTCMFLTGSLQNCLLWPYDLRRTLYVQPRGFGDYVKFSFGICAYSVVSLYLSQIYYLYTA